MNRLLTYVVLASIALSSQAACRGMQSYGSAAPTRVICTLGGFKQELVLARDFRIDRLGDDAFPADDEVRRSFAADAAAVTKYSNCPGVPEVGTLRMELQRIESGSSRSQAGKFLSWTLFIIPTLGLSSIYPLSEDRWILLELYASISVKDKKIWSGEFVSFQKAPLMQALPLPTAGAQLSALMLRAQDAAVKDLKNAMGSK